MMIFIFPLLVFLTVTLLVILSVFEWQDKRILKRAQTRLSDLTTNRKDEGRDFWEKMLISLGRKFRPKDLRQMDLHKEWLTSAGFYDPLKFYGFQVFLFLIAATAAFFWLISGGDVLWGVCLIAAGYYAPKFFVSWRQKKRNQRIFKEIPDLLDLLVSCMEAGLGFEMALLKVSEELKETTPLLSQEAALYFYETQSGMNRETALMNMSRRNAEPSLRSMISVVLQSFKFGTDVAAPLRTYSKVLRTERTQKAEEKAGMIGAKLSLPLVLLILPVLLMILVGPAVLSLHSKGFFDVFKVQ